MQRNRRGLAAICGAGIIRRLIGRRRRRIRLGVSRIGRSCVCDHTFEIGWRTDGNVDIPRGQARNAIFAKIVGALGSSLLPMLVSCDESLMQRSDFGVGQRIAFFVGYAAANDGGSLQAEMQILQFLASSKSENPAIGAAALFVSIEKPAALSEQMIAAGRDALNPECAVGTGERGVMPD